MKLNNEIYEITVRKSYLLKFQNIVDGIFPDRDI
jgi:hypothetical protein